jgi:hypothetical protein
LVCLFINQVSLSPDAEVSKYVKQVDELDERVSDLEAIVKELEEWTGELGRTSYSPKKPS